MGRYRGAIITTAGQNLIAEAIAGSGLVTFMTFETSSHQYPSSTNFQALTALDDVEQTVAISSTTVFDNNILQVSANVTNAGVAADYLIQTLGVYAKLGDNTPVLVAVIPAIDPDEMPAQDPTSPSSFLYNIQMIIQNADQINVTTNPAGTVTVPQLNIAVDEKLDKSNVAFIESTATASRAYAVGDYIAYNGKVYVVTAAIASGDTLTPGTNIDETMLGAELNKKLDKANVVNNLTTTEEGFALDARQGKVLLDRINRLIIEDISTPNNDTNKTIITTTYPIVDYQYKRQILACCVGGTTLDAAIVSAVPTGQKNITITWTKALPSSGESRVAVLYYTQ